MNTHNFIYKVVVLAMVFGFLAAPVVLAAEDKDDNPLYLIPVPGDNNEQYMAGNSDMSGVDGNEVKATATLAEEGQPTIIRDFSFEFVGPSWDRVPGKHE